MVLGYHLILTAYGFWLPNDPRGSWSNYVRSFELYQAGGPATKTNARQSVAGEEHDHAARLRAKQALMYPPVVFTGLQALHIAHGFGDHAQHTGLAIHAAAILPDHIHLIISRASMNDQPIENVATRLKSRATHHLKQADLHPLAQYPKANGTLPSPWARNAWHVFLSSEYAIGRAIQYVNDNPVKAGLKTQHWSFVTPLD